MNLQTSLRSFFLALLISAIPVIAVAQPPAKAPKQIAGGVVNGKATSLPKPVYPEDARIAKISGTVGVQVLIDETGKVISATAVSGLENVSLRQAPEIAAFKATFSPTLLSGQPVKVSGVINYNFVADKSNEEKLKPFGVATFLTMVRSFAADRAKFQKEFPPTDSFTTQLADFSEFDTEFKAIADLEKMPAGERVAAIDKAKAAIRAKLNTSDRWQFDAGIPMGEMINQFAQFGDDSDTPPDLDKLDKTKIILALNTLNDLTLSAPSDFPPDILQKIKDVATLGTKNNFSTPDDYMDFYTKIAALLEIISPGVTK